MEIKGLLKQAKEALDKKDPAKALGFLAEGLKLEPENYMCLVFSGRAHEVAGKFDKSEESYRQAASLNPGDALAWTGLMKLGQASSNNGLVHDGLMALVKVYGGGKDAEKHFEMLIQLMKLHNEQEISMRQRLEFWNFLAGDKEVEMLPKEKRSKLPSKFEILVKILEINEKEESTNIQKKYDSERKSIRATKKPEQILQDVSLEIKKTSGVTDMYQNVMNAPVEKEEQGLQTQIKLRYILRLNDLLALSSSKEEKDEYFKKLILQCEQFIKTSQTEYLPFEVVLDFKFLEGMEPSEDFLECQTYIQNFSTRPLAKIILGYLKKKDGEYDKAKQLLESGLEEKKDSVLGWKTLAEIFVHIRDIKNALEASKNAKDNFIDLSTRYSMEFSKMKISIDEIFAETYLLHGKKRLHEAQTLFEEIFKVSSQNKKALLGLSRVCMEQQKFSEAEDYLELFQKTYPEDPFGIAEFAWLEFHQKYFDNALQGLEKAISIDPTVALFHYRLGRVYWEMDGIYRTEKKYAQSKFLKTLQLDPNFSGAFTYLGCFYFIIENDIVRSRKCFQKALSLDPSDQLAATFLADIYISQKENDLVASLYDSMIQEDPYSAWAWKRLGLYQLLIKQDPEEAGNFFFKKIFSIYFIYFYSIFDFNSLFFFFPFFFLLPISYNQQLNEKKENVFKCHFVLNLVIKFVGKV